MFAVYIFFTALVLVNLLIAMMTNRYECAKRRAACTWRFNAVAFGLRIERLIARLTGCRQRCRCCRSQCDNDRDFPGRYLLKVREKRTPVTLDSEQQRLHEHVSRLDACVTDVADKINSFLRERCER